MDGKGPDEPSSHLGETTMTQTAKAVLDSEYSTLANDDKLTVGDYARNGHVSVSVERAHRDHAEDVLTDLGLEYEVTHTNEADDTVTFGVEA